MKPHSCREPPVRLVTFWNVLQSQLISETRAKRKGPVMRFAKAMRASSTALPVVGTKSVRHTSTSMSPSDASQTCQRWIQAGMTQSRHQLLQNGTHEWNPNLCGTPHVNDPEPLLGRLAIRSNLRQRGQHRARQGQAKDIHANQGSPQLPQAATANPCQEKGRHIVVRQQRRYEPKGSIARPPNQHRIPPAQRQAVKSELRGARRCPASHRCRQACDSECRDVRGNQPRHLLPHVLRPRDVLPSGRRKVTGDQRHAHHHFDAVVNRLVRQML
mmetsp:Transcript_34668/g.83215  ORF Transcript_34668/g.83215 Transcript_34668/m.83215 type:complete len:272 (-) Transcript_34668:221-1036(-)